MPPALLLARGDVAALAAAGLPFGGVGDVACRVEDRRPSAALSATALKMLSSSLRACSDDSRRSTRCFGVEEGSELDSEEEHGCVSVYVYMYVSVSVSVSVYVCLCVCVCVSVYVSVYVYMSVSVYVSASVSVRGTSAAPMPQRLTAGDGLFAGLVSRQSAIMSKMSCGQLSG